MTRRSTTRLLAASAAALTAVTLSACASSDRDDEGGGEGEAASGGTLVFGAAGDPDMFDPAFASDGETFRVSRQIYEGLLGNEPAAPTGARAGRGLGGQRGRPGVHLQPAQGVKFHDGTDFNAEAVCFNFDRWYNFEGLAQSPERHVVLPGRLRRLRQHARHPEHLRELRGDRREHRGHPAHPGDLEVPVRPGAARLLHPEPDGAGGVRRGQPQRQRGRAEYSEYAMEHPTGTGPFKFDSWDRGNGEVTIVRNDDYWGEKAKLDEIIFRTISDGNTRRQELQAGSIDGYDFVAPADYETLEDDGFQVLARDPFNILYLGINGGNVPGTAANPALQDPQVRQAIAHAIDRETIVNSLLPEGAEAAIEFMPPTVDGWADDVTTYEYDPERAKALLAEAGATGTDAAVLLPDRRQPAVHAGPGRDVPGHQPEPDRRRLRHEPTALPWNPDYLNAVQAGGADIHLLGWTGDYNDAYNFIGTFFAEAARQAKAEFGGFRRPGDLRRAGAGGRRAGPGQPHGAVQGGQPADHGLPAGCPDLARPPALVVGETVEGLEPSPLTAEVFSTVSLSD